MSRRRGPIDTISLSREGERRAVTFFPDAVHQVREVKGDGVILFVRGGAPIRPVEGTHAAWRERIFGGQTSDTVDRQAKAAPHLLGACRAARDLLEDQIKNDGYTPEVARTLTKLETAIRVAEPPPDEGPEEASAA